MRSSDLKKWKPNKIVNAKNVKVSFEHLPSFLLLGQTASGKSYLVRKIVEKLEKKYSPDELKFAFFDLKQVEYVTEGEDYHSDYLLFGIVKTSELGLERLEYLARIAETRKRMKEKHPYIFIYVEECDMAALDQKRFDNALIKILSNAQTTNMRLVYSTSRIAVNTVSKKLLQAFDVVLAGYFSFDTEYPHLKINAPNSLKQGDFFIYNPRSKVRQQPSKRYEITQRIIRNATLGTFFALILWAAVVTGIGFSVYKHFKHQPTAVSPPTTSNYSPPVKDYNGDNLFLVDYPCTPKRTETNSTPQPTPDNVSKYDYYKEIYYYCDTSVTQNYSITVDYFPESYGSQQMSDILHEYADDQINNDTYTEISKQHSTFKGNDAFYIDYKTPLPFSAIYFQKDKSIFSIEIDNASDKPTDDFLKSFRLTAK